MPHPGADPHQADFLVGRGAQSGIDPLEHLVAEALGVRDRPVRSAVPLRDHRVGHLLGDRDRTGAGGADRLRRFPDIAFLDVDLLHQVLELRLVEALAGTAFEQRDQVAHFGHHQRDPVRVINALPLIARVREPARVLVLPRRGFHRKELGAERFGPLAEHVLDAIAGHPRDQHRGLGQPAPRRGGGIVGERAGEPQRAVFADVLGVAVRRHHLEIAARKLLGRDVRRPPLVGHDRHIHRVEDLVRGIGLDDREGLTIINHAALEIDAELLLVGVGRDGGCQHLAAALSGFGAHLKTPSASSSAMRVSVRPDRCFATQCACSPMPGARNGVSLSRENEIGAAMWPNGPSSG